jgi:hypothetical protein
MRSTEDANTRFAICLRVRRRPSGFRRQRSYGALIVFFVMEAAAGAAAKSVILYPIF